MERIACGIAYEGTHYAGWQYQPTHMTIQAAIERATAQVANHSIRIIASGRTDRGVHAKAQVFHFDTACERPTQVWFAAINYYLPKDIQLIWVKAVSSDFHARFSALNRSYRYLIYQGRLPWLRRHSWVLLNKLSLSSMQAAAHHLVGQHDFSSFRAASCQSASPIRNLTKLTVTKNADWVQLDITANAFLHHMVRNIVAVLVEVGSHKRTPHDILQLLHMKDRRHASITAPPQGLYLESVTYPENFGLPLNTNDPLELLTQF